MLTVLHCRIISGGIGCFLSMRRWLSCPNYKFSQLIRFHFSCEMLPVVLRDDLYRSSPIGSKQEKIYPIQGS